MRVVSHRVQVAITQEAAEWFVRNRGGTMPEQERAAFAAWLRSSPLHVEEYLKIAVMSQNLQAATSAWGADFDTVLRNARAERDNSTISMLNQDTNAEPCFQTVRWRWRHAAVLVTVAVLILVCTVWMERDGERFGIAKTLATARGEERSWLLPDGTRLNLDSYSAVTVHYNDRERGVTVERGQALFQVARESGRRFRVDAGYTSVIATGTQFDVMRNHASTLVTVVEGKVAVFAGDAPQPTSRANLPAQALSLSAGEQIRISDHSRLAQPALADVTQTVAWVQHQIAFEQQPLGEVVEEFNRYSGVPIVIQGDKLRALPISGVFSAYDADSFVEFMSRLDDVEINRSAERILVIGKSN